MAAPKKNDPRYKTLPIIGKDDVVRRHRVRKDRIDEYAPVVVNNRGKIAYMRLDSAQIAARIVRGTGAVPVFARFHFKGESGGKGSILKKDGSIKQKTNHDLRFEVEITAVLPPGTLDTFQDKMHDFVQANSPAGVSSGRDKERSVPGASFEIRSATVFLRDVESETLSELVNARAEKVLNELIADVEPGEAIPEEAEKLLRAEQATDKNGRTYWWDPVTGQRTRDPSAVRS